MEQVRLWPANSLPIPYTASFGAQEVSSAPQTVDIDDNFPKGQIHKYFPNQGQGLIKDRAGREIFFNLAEMEFAGTKGRDAIQEGITVGYDITHSGAGLHVKKMKIY